jgi:hypothetical protein
MKKGKTAADEIKFILFLPFHLKVHQTFIFSKKTAAGTNTQPQSIIAQVCIIAFGK